MATIADEITAALQDLGLVAAGETPAPEDAALALVRVNDWVDSLALENLALYTVTRTTWALVASTTSYTIGSGGAVNVSRPVGTEQIQAIGYLDTSVSPSLETLVGRPLSEQAYQAIPQKSLTSAYPTDWYYNPTYPLGTLKPYPVPTSSSLQGVIYAKAPVSEFAVGDTISLPPGYRRWFRLELRLEMAAAFKLPPDGPLMVAAREAKMAIKRGNARERDLVLDLCAGGGRSGTYDIFSDQGS